MKYVIENIRVFLEKEESSYEIDNPLHISFGCRREDGVVGTEKAFAELCKLGECQPNESKVWANIDSLLEATLNKAGGVASIEVREKTDGHTLIKGSILKTPEVLLKKDIIDENEKEDFDLLLSISKTLKELLPEEYEYQTVSPL